MGAVETLIERNATIAAPRHVAGLRMMPSLRTILIGCVDPRVDPTEVLAAHPGELAAIRNVGGRVTPAALRELVLLRAVTRAAGADLGPGWDIVVLQHTDCGITRLDAASLAGYFEEELDALEARAVADPFAAVAHDVALVRADPRLPGVRVSGLVHDVATGLVHTVVAP
jgi:carbonic anhydrase